jgi:hypothetical protein
VAESPGDGTHVDSSGERVVQDDVDVSQRSLAEGLAPVRAAPPVALVVSASSMLYISTAAAARSAGAQARVERIHRFAVDAPIGSAPSTGRMCSRISRS